MSRIHCMVLSKGIQSLQSKWHTHYSDATKWDPNNCNTAHIHYMNGHLTTFCVFAREMNHFKDRKIKCSCICVCLLKLTHVSLQSFTILVRFVNFNLPCFFISIYTMKHHLWFRLYPLLLIWTFVPCIAKSHWRTFNRSITWSLVRFSLTCILQYSLSQHSIRKYTQEIPQN